MVPSGMLVTMIEEAATSPGHIVSMTTDRRRGRPLENDAIYGAVCRRAAEFGIQNPSARRSEFIACVSIRLIWRLAGYFVSLQHQLLDVRFQALGGLDYKYRRIYLQAEISCEF